MSRQDATKAAILLAAAVLLGAAWWLGKPFPAPPVSTSPAVPAPATTEAPIDCSAFDREKLVGRELSRLKQSSGTGECGSMFPSSQVPVYEPLTLHCLVLCGARFPAFVGNKTGKIVKAFSEAVPEGDWSSFRTEDLRCFEKPGDWLVMDAYVFVGNGTLPPVDPSEENPKGGIVPLAAWKLDIDRRELGKTSPAPYRCFRIAKATEASGD
jgi:hypothetical protein